MQFRPAATVNSSTVAIINC